MCHAQASKTEVVSKATRRSAHIHQACEHFRKPRREAVVSKFCLAGNLAFHWWVHMPDEHCELVLWNVGFAWIGTEKMDKADMPAALGEVAVPASTSCFVCPLR